MGRFILRRLLQMPPTLLGVILITFLLFNVVGGSPAKMALGEKASPRAMEDFDEQRGFNRPLIWGHRVATRAYADSDFGHSAGPWAMVDGARWEAAAGGAPGRIVLAANATSAFPFAFTLREDTTYELAVELRAGQGLRVTDRAGAELAAWPAAPDWARRTVRFNPGSRPGEFQLGLRPGAGGAEMRTVTLRRLVKNPWDSQLMFFLSHVIRLDFGESNTTNEPVIRMLAEGIGPTLCLTLPMLAGEVAITVFLALVCAWYRGRWPDRAIVVACVALMSVNYLVWIVAGQFLFAFRLGWFPIWGFESWSYLALPVLVGIVSGMGADTRFYRTVMLDELYRDYVRTALAKGVAPAGVLFRHVLKNAMIPIITNVVLAIPFLYTGSLLLESFFGIPGLGYLGVNAINNSDPDVIRAVVVIGSLLYMAANLLADLCYALVDPRVKLA